MGRMRATTAVLLGATTIAAIATGPAAGHWAMPTGVPVERVVRNVEAYLEEHPDDAEAHYLLGRVHGYAFTFTTTQVGVFERGDPGPWPNVAPDFLQDTMQPDEHNTIERPAAERLLDHLREAVEHHRRAIELDPSPARYHLGLAYLLDRGSHLASYVDWAPGAGDETTPVAPDVRLAIREAMDELTYPADRNRDEALRTLRDLIRNDRPGAINLVLSYRTDAYEARQAAVAQLLEEAWKRAALEPAFEAFARSIDEDLTIEEQPLRGLRALASYEAGQMYLRLVEELNATEGPDCARISERVARVKEGLEELEAKPENLAITPIVFALDEPRPLEDLLLPNATVEFDLDGDGDVERWPWVKPDTGILAWDPEGTGEITSGRQLFGTATWWMLFSDGYRALDTLDDDRDGRLAGDELDGLALWFDRNTNGVSEPGEVVPVEAAGVASIATRSTGRAGASPMNDAGVETTDGRVRPSYDWVTSPAPAPGDAARSTASRSAATTAAGSSASQTARLTATPRAPAWARVEAFPGVMPPIAR